MQLFANNLYFLQFFISETKYIALTINFIGIMPEPAKTAVVAYSDAITPLIGKPIVAKYLTLKMLILQNGVLDPKMFLGF